MFHESPAFSWNYQKGLLHDNFIECKRNDCPRGLPLYHESMKLNANTPLKPLVTIEKQDENRATAVFYLRKGWIERRLMKEMASRGDNMKEPDYSNNGWTLFLEFNTTLQDGNFNTIDGQHLSTTRRGQAISFTSFEDTADILSLTENPHRFEINFLFEQIVPDFKVIGVYLIEGSYANLQCHFDSDFSRAGIIDKTNSSNEIPEDFNSFHPWRSRSFRHDISKALKDEGEEFIDSIMKSYKRIHGQKKFDNLKINRQHQLVLNQSLNDLMTQSASKCSDEKSVIVQDFKHFYDQAESNKELVGQIRDKFQLLYNALLSDSSKSSAGLISSTSCSGNYNVYPYWQKIIFFNGFIEN